MSTPRKTCCEMAGWEGTGEICHDCPLTPQTGSDLSDIQMGELVPACRHDWERTRPFPEVPEEVIIRCKICHATLPT